MVTRNCDLCEAERKYIFHSDIFCQLDYMTLVLKSQSMQSRDARQNPPLEPASLELHATEHGAMCPASAAIELLQEKWVLFIVRSLLKGAKGFNELRREVGGCNPSTLSERLDTLEKRGIITKTVCSTMPPRTSYELTFAGFALQNVILEIDAWSRQHLKVAL